MESIKLKTNLWLDDIRDCPFVGNWKIAKNYQEALTVLQNFSVIDCYLDHDLSVKQTLNQPCTEKTGYDVVLWMEANNVWPLNPPIVHSLNPVGSDRMAKAIAHHYGCDPQTLKQPYRKEWIKNEHKRTNH